jgi:hypothetical protein
MTKTAKKSRATVVPPYPKKDQANLKAPRGGKAKPKAKPEVKAEEPVDPGFVEVTPRCRGSPVP